MKTYRVLYSPLSESQLEDLYRGILATSGRPRAERVVGALVQTCDELRHFPFRGRPRDDLRPGVRVITYRRWATIVFAVGDEWVRILAIYTRGRDVASAIVEDL